VSSAPVPRLHILTDETVQSRWSHLDIARFAVAGGADAVQFREKRLRTTRELVETARAIRAVCEGSHSLLVVDDRADVAAAAGAHGVHLGRDDLDPDTARRLLGPGALIGRTANSYAEAAAVWHGPIDYLGVGPVFGTLTKANPAPPLGLEALASICRDSPVPVVAIGSITPERIPDVIAAGAHGVAVVSAVVCSDDPMAAVRACREALDRALAAKGAPR
jgi:thiamine-phosphate pyrophosphorylase